MIFSWLRNRRRRNLLAKPFPEEWQRTLEERVGHYRLVSDKERDKLRDIVRILIAEKDWEGCRDLEVTDAMRVVIAASAGVLILGFDDYYFDNVNSILVRPNALAVKSHNFVTGEVAMEEDVEELGLAFTRGTVMVSWDKVDEHAARPGRGWNLVFHEFAHQLDMVNGDADGVPILANKALQERWQRIMNEEFVRLQQAERKHRRTVLDKYGAHDPGEFFAVATECFFDSPRAMKETYPELYQLFCDYFRQDPAAWPSFEAS